MSENNLPSLKAHLFICTSCQFKTSEDELSDAELAVNFRSNIKKVAVERWGKANVRVSAVKCLGECERGIASVLYPKAQWRCGLRPGDESKMVQWIEESITKSSSDV